MSMKTDDFKYARKPTNSEGIHRKIAYLVQSRAQLVANIHDGQPLLSQPHQLVHQPLVLGL